ncbi:hypothetical protein BH11ARM2_BH11ARM2_04890 [soil metagenome]
MEAYYSMLELAFFELGEAFKGLADENVWKRPAGPLLSVGELAGHIAYWEAVRFAGEGGSPWPDPAKCRVKSPLIDARFAYYTHTVEASPAALALSADQVHAELLRVHQESLANLKALNPNPESEPPGLPGWTYRESLKYTVFHVSYHTGQIYSVRHLLGEQTPDN